jgi:hypothetical protein
MKRPTLAATVLLAVVITSASAALAEPPKGDDGHAHLVVAGNGVCVGIDAVTLRLDVRGLHQGANASGTTHGPWHGSCD